MKIFEKLKELYPNYSQIQDIGVNRFSLLNRSQLYDIAFILRTFPYVDHGESFEMLKKYTYRYSSQTTEALASNLYKWCKKYL